MTIFGARVPFAESSGIEEIEIREGKTRLRLLSTPSQTNNIGVLHGGLLCTLLDVAMGSAARCLLGHPVMTLNMQVSFLAPANAPLQAEGRVLKPGKSVVFCEAEATDTAGVVVAKASGVFKPARTL
jgi:uncharacterized protein (TIGR00369 family)